MDILEYLNNKNLKVNDNTEIVTTAMRESNAIPQTLDYILNYFFCDENSNTMTISDGFVNIILYNGCVGFHFVF
jgi:hypothetical protein